MILATSTNILCERPDGSRAPLPQTIKLAKEVGFQAMDLNFYDWSRPGTPFLTDNWESWCHEIGEASAQHSIPFPQCHAYCYRFLDHSATEEERQYHENLTRRSLLCASRLGATVVAIHPDTDWNAFDTGEASLRGNIDYFHRLMEFAAPLGIDLAVENMCDYNIRPRKKYAAEPHQLLHLVDTLNDPRIGVCWDFEHGSIMGQNQVEALRRIGPRLRIIHVSETLSPTDGHLMHTLPFSAGDIPWEPILRQLGEMLFPGPFCFEAHNFMNRIPDPLVPAAMAYAAQVGRYLLGLGEVAE